MENLLKKTEDLRERFLKMKQLLDIDGKISELHDKQRLMAEPDFWSDQASAIKVGQIVEALINEIKDWQDLERDLRETEEIMALANKEGDLTMETELENKYSNLLDKFSKLEFLTLFSGSHDKANVILSIHAGTGGVDAQDWAQMLERMYLRFAEKRKFTVEIELMKISGPYAYADLQSENGVHRLLRVSPFDAENLRHTSFALVEVMPDLPEADTITIREEDLRWDVFRSSGPGGQSVNTTDSAVRLTHIPTNTVVTCQSERSQHQNREIALKIMKAKLYQLALTERSLEERKLKGEVQKAEWGKQIRSYFMYGNRLVKD
ncbi:MAG: PCRF domain-containing protein, partial [Candidatus Falkowbacteria bacterium]|nr:PCRF domain-containing protein [Candidatus Falkowbacteria bacterium]